MMALTKGIHQGVEVDEIFRLYDWAFYIHEPESGRHVRWDVECRKSTRVPSMRMSAYLVTLLTRIGTTTYLRLGHCGRISSCECGPNAQINTSRPLSVVAISSTEAFSRSTDRGSYREWLPILPGLRDIPTTLCLQLNNSTVI